MEKGPERYEMDDQILLTVSEIFKALSDPTRLKILYLLSYQECAVNDIAHKLSLGQSTVSHQLRVLKGMRLVTFRREGTSLYYSYDDEHVMTILKETIEHALHD